MAPKRPAYGPADDPRFTLHHRQPRANKLDARQRLLCLADPAYAEALGNPALSPSARILAYYRELLAHFQQQDRVEYHCFIGSLSFEMSELLPAIGAQVDAIYAESLAILERCLLEARACGELAADEDCANLASFITCAWQGVLGRLKVGHSIRPVEEFVVRLQRVLQG